MTLLPFVLLQALTWTPVPDDVRHYAEADHEFFWPEVQSKLKIGNRVEDAEVIAQLLDDKSKPVRILACQILQELGPVAAASAPRLERLAKSSSRAVRPLVIATLAKVSPNAEPGLRLYSSGNRQTRTNVVYAFGQQPRTSSLDALLKAALADSDDEVFGGAIRTLAVSPAFSELHAEVLAAAIGAVRYCYVSISLDLSEGVDVRVFACDALCKMRIDDEATAMTLEKRLRESLPVTDESTERSIVADWAVAVIVLSNGTSDFGTQTLKSLLANDSVFIRRCALEAIEKHPVAGKGCIQQVIACLKNNNESEQEKVCQVLRRLAPADQQSVEAMVACLGSSHRYVQQYACLALHRMSPSTTVIETALDQVEKSLSLTEVYVPDFTRALGKLTTRDATGRASQKLFDIMRAQKCSVGDQAVAIANMSDEVKASLFSRLYENCQVSERGELVTAFAEECRRIGAYWNSED